MRLRRFFPLLAVLGFMLGIAHGAAPRVVINEIHFNPANKRPLEFVELHNPTEKDIRLNAR